ncbi:helix-turn-helix domain-containing protein [Hyphomicrobium sp. 1Nfss2.1]|uniref:helix-turn-helix domain-containing protein n=1 Tax=Hyphomicrobium sp. 1Nfss2.1 TaxID=3413936 RepID=UPI003C7CE8D9
MRRGYEPARPYPVARPQAARTHAPVAPPPSQAALAADISRFFHDLRGALGLSPMQAAQALSTRVDIIAALEAGQVQALPLWPETCRIVRSYAGLAGLDPRPVLHILEQLFVAAPRAQVSQPAPRRPLIRNINLGGQSSAPIIKAIGGSGKRAAQAARRVSRVVNDHAGRPGMALFTVTLGIAMIVLITQTSVLEAAVSQLPPSMKRIVRGAQNYVIVRFAPVRDGLRWIDVPDPRTRRGDKLQTAAQ